MYPRNYFCIFYSRRLSSNFSGCPGWQNFVFQKIVVFFFDLNIFWRENDVTRHRGMITACLMIPLQLKTKQNISEEYRYKVPLPLSQPSSYNIFRGSAPCTWHKYLSRAGGRHLRRRSVRWKEKVRRKFSSMGERAPAQASNISSRLFSPSN